MRHLVAHAGRHLSLKQGDGGASAGRRRLVRRSLDDQGSPRNLRRSIEGNLWVAGRVLPGIARAACAARLDRPGGGGRPGAAAGGDAGHPRPLPCGHQQRLHPGADRRADDGGCGAGAGGGAAGIQPGAVWVTREGWGRRYSPPSPSSIFLVGTRRAASARPTKSKGGVWGGNAFSSPTFPGQGKRSRSASDATRHGRPGPDGRQHRAAAAASGAPLRRL